MESHLLQMRGLKPLPRPGETDHSESHLLQMRGLKLFAEKLKIKHNCRIFYRCVD